MTVNKQTHPLDFDYWRSRADLLDGLAKGFAPSECVPHVMAGTLREIADAIRSEVLRV